MNKNASKNINAIIPNTQKAFPALTIAGSDCSGGAGIQADLKTFGAHNVFGMSVVLSVVAENTARVISSHDVPRDSINAQFEAIFEDIPPLACKIGMLGSAEIIECVAQNLARYKPRNVVIDPVMFAKNGFALMPESIRDHFKNTILGFADVLTPNIPEAQALCGVEIHNTESMKTAARKLFDMGAKSVLLKGGHKEENCDDVFYDGREFHTLRAQKIQTKNTHGTGCTLSSAIAANLALGKGMLDSITLAKEYVFNAILHSFALGKGNGPTNHFWRNTL